MKEIINICLKRYLQLKKNYPSIFNDGYVDESKKKELKRKLVNDDFKFGDGLNINEFIESHNNNYINSIRSKISNELNSSCSKNGLIDDETYQKLKYKYYNIYSSVYDKINLDEIIIEKNNALILDEFDSFLSSGAKIDEKTRLKMKSKYNMSYYKFYNNLKLNKKINEHNKSLKPKILKKELTSLDGCISDRKLIEMKSRYSINLNWDNIVFNYNRAYENKIEKLNSDNFSFQYLDKNIDIKKSSNNVYYIHPYIKSSKLSKYPYYADMSRKILSFKKGDQSAVNFFTNELINVIMNLSNRMDCYIHTLALISIPPANVNKNAFSSMRKSIYYIKKAYDDGFLMSKYNSNKNIVDYGNLLYRFLNVPKSHLGSRPSVKKHMDTILCTKKDFYNENTAYILLDDITTKGNIMNACQKILVENNVNIRNIYKIALAQTHYSKR